MLKCDKWISKMVKYRSMIVPFVDRQVSTVNGVKIYSFGLSSYGYDIRCADEFYISNGAYDLEEFSKTDSKSFGDGRCGIMLDPGKMCLTRSVEWFRIPRDCLGVCVGKSTYARHGIIVNVTPLEPEWEGYLTIELSNTSSRAVPIMAHEGIAQLLFHGVDEVCETSYKDRNGKYQNQKAKVVFAK